MKHILFGLLLATSLSGLAGCGDLLGPAGEVPLALRVQADALEIHNRTERAVYYFAVDSEMVALINWVPCSDPDACARVTARSRSTIPASAVLRWGSSPQVTVYWWHLVPDGEGGFRPDRIRMRTVSL